MREAKWAAIGPRHLVNLDHVEHIEIEVDGGIYVQLRNYSFHIFADDPGYELARGSIKDVFGI